MAKQRIDLEFNAKTGEAVAQLRNLNRELKQGFAESTAATHKVNDALGGIHSTLGKTLGSWGAQAIAIHEAAEMAIQFAESLLAAMQVSKDHAMLMDRFGFAMQRFGAEATESANRYVEAFGPVAFTTEELRNALARTSTAARGTSLSLEDVENVFRIATNVSYATGASLDTLAVSMVRVAGGIDSPKGLKQIIPGLTDEIKQFGIGAEGGARAIALIDAQFQNAATDASQNAIAVTQAQEAMHELNIAIGDLVAGLAPLIEGVATLASGISDLSDGLETWLEILTQAGGNDVIIETGTNIDELANDFHFAATEATALAPEIDTVTASLRAQLDVVKELNAQDVARGLHPSTSHGFTDWADAAAEFAAGDRGGFAFDKAKTILEAGLNDFGDSGRGSSRPNAPTADQAALRHAQEGFRQQSEIAAAVSQQKLAVMEAARELAFSTGEKFHAELARVFASYGTAKGLLASKGLGNTPSIGDIIGGSILAAIPQATKSIDTLAQTLGEALVHALAESLGPLGALVEGVFNLIEGLFSGGSRRNRGASHTAAPQPTLPGLRPEYNPGAGDGRIVVYNIGPNFTRDESVRAVAEFHNEAVRRDLLR